MDHLQNELVLKQIACEIKKNRNNLHSNLRNLRTFQKDNKFLRQIYDDYEDYHNFIINQKKEQELTILRLLHYLEKNMLDSNLTERMLQESKHEQSVLLEKLYEVRNDLEKVVNEADDTVTTIEADINSDLE
jgi:septal ring factor EnvC (AmiA/AmiB activator)|tara:strand:+ start:663 stop:1058 length:396 start_codon:yes stop_codon:yes gene_type:complete